jgi:hypothetical protein
MRARRAIPCPDDNQVSRDAVGWLWKGMACSLPPTSMKRMELSRQ